MERKIPTESEISNNWQKILAKWTDKTRPSGIVPHPKYEGMSMSINPDGKITYYMSPAASTVKQKAAVPPQPNGTRATAYLRRFPHQTEVGFVAYNPPRVSNWSKGAGLLKTTEDSRTGVSFNLLFPTDNRHRLEMDEKEEVSVNFDFHDSAVTLEYYKEEEFLSKAKRAGLMVPQ